MDSRRVTTIGLILAAGLVVSGCTAATTDAERTASPTASATPSATETAEPTPSAEVAAERAQLPIPPEEIADWAKTAVPADSTTTFSGWMSEHSALNHSSTFRSLEPGTYQGQIACRGEGTISLSAGDVDLAAAGEPVVCANSTIAFDVTTTATGMQVDLALDGAPTVYAVSLLKIA